MSLSEQLRKTDEFLRSLNKAEFLTFIREAGKDPRCTNEHSEAAGGMAIFAKSYKAGPGKDERLTDTLEQLHDPTLPTTWKIGLLDVLRLSQRPNVLEEDFEPVVGLLRQCGEDKRNSDVFRAFCLGKLAYVLNAQKSLLIKKFPDLKGPVEAQDKPAIDRINRSQPDNLLAGKVLKLLEDIGKLTTALQAAAKDVKDEQLKSHLKKHLAAWRPVSGNRRADNPVP